MSTKRFPFAPSALCTALLLALPFAPALAQETPPAPQPLSSQAPLPQSLTPLTIQTIMRGPELWGNKPESVTWSLDSSRVYFRWKEASAPLRAPLSWYVVMRDDAKAAPRKLSPEEVQDITPLLGGGDLTRDGKRLVFEQTGDLWLMEAGVAGRRRLTQTPTDSESMPRWTKDEKSITYVRGDNLYVFPIVPTASRTDAFPLVKQVTNIADAPTPVSVSVTGTGRGGGRNGGASSAPINRQNGNGEKAVAERQRELFGVLRDRAAQSEADAAERKAALTASAPNTTPTPKLWTPAPNQTVVGLSLAPDETQVLAQVSERPSAGVPPTTTSIVPEWITENAHVTAQPGRPNVGEADERTTRFVLLSAASGAALPVVAPENLQNRAMNFGNAQWSNDGAALVLSARTADNHDRFLFLVDRATGKTTLIHDAHDDAWIGGPGAFSWGWMPDDKNVWVVSETGGWAHLATVPIIGGGQETPLTAGPFEVFAPALTRAKTAWYFTSSENNTGERHFWTMPASGGTRKQITDQPGIENAVLSPDEKTLAVLSSSVNRPPELFLQDNRANDRPRRVTVSPSPLFSTYQWRDVPTITFSARDGAKVPARLFTPTVKNVPRNGAAVVFVHGAGYLQNAHRGWSQYEHEYLFHHFLADHGYTVLDVDYRGSAGYGRNVRTAVYKHMGGADLNDAEDGAKWLVQTRNVDAKRIGIYGGSYGGFLTLMALFTQPDTWVCGAALRPVSDWSLYNQGYSSNILGLPQTDYAPYRLSSPIYYAQNLKGGLLICHGMEDSNVFFADTVRLTQRLIELGKTNWDVAFYPVEDHTFTEAASWTDEFKRIFSLFEKYLAPSPPVP